MPWPRWTDFLAALRSLRATPVITLSAVVCLGLGIAVATDVASAVDRALLQTMPVRDPGRLVVVHRTTPNFDRGPFAIGTYGDLAAQARQLEGLAALNTGRVLVTLPTERAQVRAASVTANTFAVLGASPQRGRLLVPADGDDGPGEAAVVSDRFWRDHLGASAAAIGTTLQVDGTPRTVVGVLPPDFHVRFGARVIDPDVWTPFRFTPEQRSTYRSNFLLLVGRLKPGATVAGADAEMQQLAARLVEAHPELRGEGARVRSLVEESTAGVRTPLLLLSSAVVMVLLIAATNVASLLLARGLGRRRDTAVRVALGASARDVMRPVVAECLLLAAGSLALALALGWVGIRTIGTLATSARVPQVAGLAMDLRIVAFSTLLALVVALVCGLVPAWRNGNVDPQDALRGGRGGGAGRSHHRLLGTLVVVEVALSLMLLIGAGLAMRGFVGLLDRDPGFDAARLLAVDATLPPERYPDGDAGERFLEPALDALRQVPGVRAAGSINLLPYVNWGWNSNIRYQGMPAEDPTRLPLVEYRVVTPGFFEVTGQRLVAGRILQPGDDERPQSPRVAVVNEALVRRDFPGRDPIGHRFHLGDTSFVTIVGVVSDIRNFGPFEEPRPESYFPHAQRDDGGASFSMLLRVDGIDPQAIAPQVRTALRGVDAETVITRLEPMDDVIGTSLGQPRFFLTLLAVFAVVAVLLALAGVYGVMSYAVAQRRREIGIRTALGSTPATTLRLMLGRGGRLVVAGLAIGVLGSLATTRFLQGLLYGVSPLDGATWLFAVTLLAVAGLLAAFVPARRSLAVEPTIALREE